MDRSPLSPALSSGPPALSIVRACPVQIKPAGPVQCSGPVQIKPGKSPGGSKPAGRIEAREESTDKVTAKNQQAQQEILLHDTKYKPIAIYKPIDKNKPGPGKIPKNLHFFAYIYRYAKKIKKVKKNLVVRFFVVPLYPETTNKLKYKHYETQHHHRHRPRRHS